MVKGILNDVLTRKRSLDYTKKTKKSPFPVVWVQTFGPATPKISELVTKANKALKLSPCWKDEDRPLGVVSRRGKNLGDLLLNRKKFSLEPEKQHMGTMRCTPKVSLPKPGRKCEGCELMSESNSIKSNVSGQTYLVDGGDCKTKRVIYAAECCKCNMQYVGQTVTPLRTRISGHRSWMKKKKDDKGKDPDALIRKDEGALAEHLKVAHKFTTAEDFNKAYKFSILKSNPNNFDKSEQKWISKLVTMHPFGLNLDKPCGVSSSLLEMTARQK